VVAVQQSSEHFAVAAIALVSSRYVRAARILPTSKNIPGPARNAFSRRFPTLTRERYLRARWEFPLETSTVSTLAFVAHSQKRAGTLRG
jgi:hypothetical protein